MKCVGFGEYTGKCENEALGGWSKYWCKRCNKLRIEHIAKQFEIIESEIKKLKESECEP